MDAKQPLQSYFSLVPPAKLYHYTGIGALIGIAQNHNLWATHINYLNDSKELLHAVEFLHTVLDNIFLKEIKSKSEFSSQFSEWLRFLPEVPYDVFVFSLSEEENLLSQWRSYTPHGKGVSIEFPEWTVKKILAANGVRLGKCLYTKEEQNQLLLSLIEFLWASYQELTFIPSSNPEHREFFNSHRISILQALALVKHEAFSEEKEWRFIKCVEHSGSTLSFREGGTMLIPYSTLSLDKTKPWFGNIRLGPSENPDLALASFSRFLAQNRLCRSVVSSAIPYRKW